MANRETEVNEQPKIDLSAFEGTRNSAKKRLAEIKRETKSNNREVRRLREENDKLSLEKRNLQNVVAMVDQTLNNGDDDEEYDDGRW